MRFWAHIALGIWLILQGLVRLGGIHVQGSSVILAIIGIVAGVLFVIADRGEAMLQRIATGVLAAWLILSGLMPLLHLNFRGSGVVLAVLAITAGVLLLIKR